MRNSRINAKLYNPAFQGHSLAAATPPAPEQGRTRCKGASQGDRSDTGVASGRINSASETKEQSNLEWKTTGGRRRRGSLPSASRIESLSMSSPKPGDSAKRNAIHSGCVNEGATFSGSHTSEASCNIRGVVCDCTICVCPSGLQTERRRSLLLRSTRAMIPYSLVLR